MDNRTDWVDYAKGIGILLVVYGHVGRGLFRGGIYTNETLYALTDSIIYSFHMPVFFFFSGLFFQGSLIKRGPNKFIQNKVDTILYPFLLWSILQGSTEILLSNYTYHDVHIHELFMFWEPRAQFWFLIALFLVFCLSAALFSYLSILKKYTSILIIITSLLYVFQHDIATTTLAGDIYDNFIFFVLGIVFHKHKCERYFDFKGAFIILTSLFVISQYVFHETLSMHYENKGIESLLLATISIAFIVKISMMLSAYQIRFFAFLGASSMAIYLMHILASSGTRIILHKGLQIDSLPIHIIVGCISGIILPLIAKRISDIIKFKYLMSAPLSKWFSVSSWRAKNTNR